MKTTIVCYVNSDDALLAWTADELPDGLRSFAVERAQDSRRTRRGPRLLPTPLDRWCELAPECRLRGWLRGRIPPLYLHLVAPP